MATKPQIAHPSNLQSSHKGWRAAQTALPTKQHFSCGTVCTHLIKVLFIHLEAKQPIFMLMTAVAKSIQFSDQRCLPHTIRVKCFASPWSWSCLIQILFRKQLKESSPFRKVHSLSLWIILSRQNVVFSCPLRTIKAMQWGCTKEKPYSHSH